MTKQDPLADALDELYSLEPSAFIARRNALAAEFQAAGNRVGAAAVKAAQKPTVSALAVNRLVRSEPALVDELVAATTEVVRAQLGSKGRTYQEALAERRSVEGRVNEALHTLGASEPVVQRAMASLRAGSLTAETRDLIRAGHLSKDLEMPDVDVLFEGAAAPKKRSAPAATIDRRAQEREAERERQAAERQARAAAEEAHTEAREAIGR